MLEINFNQRKIEIDLPNGVYNLGILSGTGKTYLCNAFKYLGSHGYPVRGYTYEDYLDGKSLKSYINKKIQVILSVQRATVQYLKA